MQETKNIASQILNTSANLLGICFVVITGLNVSLLADHTYMDEVAGAASILFLISAIFSYIYIRKASATNTFLYRIADIVFILGICILSLAIILLTLNFIR